MTTFKDLRLAWTDCDEAEDYVVPNVLSPRDLVFRPDIMDETVKSSSFVLLKIICCGYLLEPPQRGDSNRSPQHTV